MSGIYSIEALQSIYKSHSKGDIDKPTVEELLNKVEPEPISKAVEPVSEIVESVEERMMKLYEEKERKSNNDYQKTLYENPPPLNDDEKRKSKWRNGRRYLNS